MKDILDKIVVDTVGQPLPDYDRNIWNIFTVDRDEHSTFLVVENRITHEFDTECLSIDKHAKLIATGEVDKNTVMLLIAEPVRDELRIMYTLERLTLTEFYTKTAATGCCDYGEDEIPHIQFGLYDNDTVVVDGGSFVNMYRISLGASILSDTFCYYHCDGIRYEICKLSGKYVCKATLVTRSNVMLDLTYFNLDSAEPILPLAYDKPTQSFVEIKNIVDFLAIATSNQKYCDDVPAVIDRVEWFESDRAMAMFAEHCNLRLAHPHYTELAEGISLYDCGDYEVTKSRSGRALMFRRKGSPKAAIKDAYCGAHFVKQIGKDAFCTFVRTGSIDYLVEFFTFTENMQMIRHEDAFGSTRENRLIQVIHDGVLHRIVSTRPSRGNDYKSYLDIDTGRAYEYLVFVDADEKPKKKHFRGRKTLSGREKPQDLKIFYLEEILDECYILKDFFTDEYASDVLYAPYGVYHEMTRLDILSEWVYGLQAERETERIATDTLTKFDRLAPDELTQRVVKALGRETDDA